MRQQMRQFLLISCGGRAMRCTCVCSSLGSVQLRLRCAGEDGRRRGVTGYRLETVALYVIARKGAVICCRVWLS